MNSLKQIVSIAKTMSYVCFLLTLITSCQELECNSPDMSEKHYMYMKFTDNSIDETDYCEYIYCDAEEQSVALILRHMTEPNIPLPTSLDFRIIYYNDLGFSRQGETNVMYNYFPDVENSISDVFYKIWRQETKTEEGSKPSIIVKLDHNGTGQERELTLMILSDKGYDPVNNSLITGMVRIIQKPETEDNGTFRNSEDSQE
ncbi:MAG: hypothetical protein J5995_05470 [Muribaculaceae bacterium]|nr:hypothetical protein [Muribaculaceae bacterium]